VALARQPCHAHRDYERVVAAREPLAERAVGTDDQLCARVRLARPALNELPLGRRLRAGQHDDGTDILVLALGAHLLW